MVLKKLTIFAFIVIFFFLNGSFATVQKTHAGISLKVVHVSNHYLIPAAIAIVLVIHFIILQLSTVHVTGLNIIAVDRPGRRR